MKKGIQKHDRAICCIIALFFWNATQSSGQTQALSLQTRSYGVNRRTQTLGGRVGVSGVFSEPVMASDALLLRNRTVPQPYVGGGMSSGGVNVQVDAGFGYYPAWVSRYSVTPARWGSVVFYTVTNAAGLVLRTGTVNGTVKNGEPFAVPRGQLGSYFIRYEVLQDGAVVLALQSRSTSPFSENTSIKVPGVFPLSLVNGKVDASTSYVKRVTGLTQDAPTGLNAVGTATLNNTFMSGCEFSEGKVAHLVVDALGRRKLVWEDWKAGFNNVDETGYGPGGKNGKGRWIIDFTGEEKRKADGSDPNSPNRYIRETANISLALPGAKGKTRKLKMGNQAPRIGH